MPVSLFPAEFASLRIPAKFNRSWATSAIVKSSVPMAIARIPCAWAVLAVIAGCSGETGPQCFPVRGEVRLDKQPLAEAMIVFHPLDSDEPEMQKPLAYSDHEGNFEVTTNQPQDGAPPGEYAITVELRELKQDGDVMIRDGRNLLPERYRDPAKSGLRFVVEAEPNEVPVIDLESK